MQTMMSRLPRVILLGLAMSVSVGCSSSLMIRRLEPASVNLGASRKLSIFQLGGPPDARKDIIWRLGAQAHFIGHFKIEDRLSDGNAVEETAAGVRFAEGYQGTPLAPDEVGVRIDVLHWDATEGFAFNEKKDKDGKVVSREKVTFFDATVVLAVTAFNSKGKPFMSRKRYAASARDDWNAEWALRDASGTAIASLLSSITPREVVNFIQLDDDDEAQHPILDLANKGDVQNAVAQMEAYAQDNPSSASALYNLAALKDASGQYSEALKIYDRALSLAGSSAKDYYWRTRGECELRSEDQQALAR